MVFMGNLNFSKDIVGVFFVALFIVSVPMVAVEGSSNLTFIEHVISTGYDGALYAEAVDIDLDGDIDIITSASNGDKISLWENELNTFTEYVIDDSFDDVIHIHASDLDNDGDIDIMGGSQRGNELSWWENNAMTFTKRIVSTNIAGAHSLYSGDIDQDGDLDLFSTSRNDISWWENNGSQDFSQRTLFSRSGSSSRSFIRYIFALDLDNDADIDFISGDNIWAPNPTENTIYYWINDGNQVFSQKTLEGITYATFHGFHVGDLDNDGDIDLCATNPSKDQIDWFENDGQLNFTQHTITTTFEGANSVVPGDLDNDGDLDLIAAAYLGDKISWFENEGNQSFNEHILRENFDGADYSIAADINKDGQKDVLALAWEGDEIIWLEQTTGKETTSTPMIFLGIESVVVTWVTASIILKRRKNKRITSVNIKG